MMLSNIENTTIELVIMLSNNIFIIIIIIEVLSPNENPKNECFHFAINMLNIIKFVNFYHTAVYEIIPHLPFTRQFHLALYEKRTASHNFLILIQFKVYLFNTFTKIWVHKLNKNASILHF
jgi:hypothetical protein